jgi:S-adenosylmethionine synthetase
MKKEWLLTSESVSEGHPDKVADQISDVILDVFLAGDALARVACETLVTKGIVVVAGEISSCYRAPIPDTVRWLIKDVGYTDKACGFDYRSCKIITRVNKQSPEISRAIESEDGEMHAGDQVTVFGYATNETDEFMPLGIMLAHALVREQAELRRRGEFDWLRPDAKSQVTVRYAGARPVSVEKVVFSTQHSPDVSHEELEEAVISEIIEEVIPKELKAPHIQYLINPGGSFTIGGPAADTGLTGRKIMVDTYGPGIPHGGGGFSGKDPTKLDRSAAYMARYIAKNIVAASLGERCTVQISYAMGKIDPVSFTLDLHGTGKVNETKLMEAVRQIFSLTPAGIINMLDLRQPIYQKTSTYGHFGRRLPGFMWERTDKVMALQNHFGIRGGKGKEDEPAEMVSSAGLRNFLFPGPPYLVMPTNEGTDTRLPIVFVPNESVKPRGDELTIVMREPYRDTKLTEAARKEVVTVVSWLAKQSRVPLSIVFDQNDSVSCEPNGSVKADHDALSQGP